MDLLGMSVFASVLVAMEARDTSTIVDLSHTHDENSITWPTDPKYNFTSLVKGQFANYWLEMNKFQTPEHYGTHMDAPAHLSKGKWKVHEIPVDRLIGPAVVIDISEKAERDPDAQLEISDILEWEKRYGRIPDGAIVFMYCGWATRWPNPSRYFNTDQPTVPETFHFPGFNETAASWLVTNRNTIHGVGVDTASIDYGQSVKFLSHQVFFAQNIYGLENVANLDTLPAVGARVYAFPIKLFQGSGCPIRIVAVLEEETSSALMRIPAQLIAIPALLAYLLTGYLP